MARVFSDINADLKAWIARQPVFFVASAPLAEAGHVNVSPRGLDTLRVLGPLEVAWLDLTGSGNETAAHLQENGRLTVMFCAFEGPPRILRLYGRGRVVLPGSTDWERLRPQFPDWPGARQIIHLSVQRVQTSCGSGVPLMTYQSQRDNLPAWALHKGVEGLQDYRGEKNVRSIDGLLAPGFSAEPPDSTGGHG